MRKIISKDFSFQKIFDNTRTSQIKGMMTKQKSDSFEDESPTEDPYCEFDNDDDYEFFEDYQ